MSDDLYDGPCKAGCMHFHGGEVRHHEDCGHYPESLTKMNADRIEELEAKLAKAVAQMQRVKDFRYDPNIGVELNRLEEILAELKGETDEG